MWNTLLNVLLLVKPTKIKNWWHLFYLVKVKYIKIYTIPNSDGKIKKENSKEQKRKAKEKQDEKIRILKEF